MGIIGASIELKNWVSVLVITYKDDKKFPRSLRVYKLQIPKNRNKHSRHHSKQRSRRLLLN